MEQYTVVIILMALAIVLSVVAPKLRIPYPILLLIAGISVGFIPRFQGISISPDVVFLIFLPPMLYSAAHSISIPEFRKNLQTISYLAITLIFITTAGIAVLAHYLIPGMTWPLAFVLGAILSPPDAVAASGVTKGMGLNHKTLTILEGESLMNDASALVAFRFAVAAVAGISFVPWKAFLEFGFALGGGVIFGFLLWFIFSAVLQLVKKNSMVTTSLNLLLPFVGYLVAEELHVSGVIAVVTAGLFVAKHRDRIFSEEARTQSKSVWQTGTFLLNGLIFILIGLQFPQVLKSIGNESILPLTAFAFLIFLVALGIRLLLLSVHKFNLGRRYKSMQKQLPEMQRRMNIRKYRMEKKRQLRFKDNHPQEGQSMDFQLEDYRPISWKETLIIGWSGMRGIVSLAAAISLPLTMVDGSVFPERDVIIFLTVLVVVIMLLVQGLGLPLLVRLLKIDANIEQ